MMSVKKFAALALVLLTTFTAWGQAEKRVKFDVCFEPSSKPGEGEIIVTANMQKGFHIFAFDPGGDGSQVPTNLVFKPMKNVTLVGKVTEKDKPGVHDIDGVGTVRWYEGKARFGQKVKYKKLEKGELTFSFQVCNESFCERPADLPVKFDLTKGCDGSLLGSTGKVDTTNKAAAKTPDTTSPTAASVVVNSGEDTAKTSTGGDSQAEEMQGMPDENGNYGKFGKPVGDCGGAKQESLSPWLAFLYGILGGFAALFFPCTLPMIPMTISFFLKNKEGKKAGVRNGIFYGFSIFLVYFLLSVPFLFFNIGGDALSNLSTNPWLNIFLFAIFIVFAFSLFGFYDISLPSGLASKVDSKSSTKDFPGIFFMALTLAIVSFSCTGPILGLVLGSVQNAKLITPAMSGFGIGLGVPFALFAIFPNLLKALPKSGGWLTTLKVVFGFVEIAFALKFLSNADLVKQWGLLKRETFIALWVIVLVLLALYLFGIFRIKKSEVYKRTTTATVLGVLSLIFAGYLCGDFFNKDISLVSGFPPPKFYSYSYKEEKHKNGEAAKSHTVNGLTTYLSLEDALAEAKKQGKPVMIDFTGWACVNCRKMEENVWVKPGIYELLKDKYIIASLYVDEKTPLPDDQKFASPFLKGMANTVGDKWFDLSLRHFKSASQPFYALIDPVSERILTTPVPYTPEAKKYQDWLECGLTNYASLRGTK
ncbi:MAG: hypothetical protein RL660_2979 [Bacteroidota bacterium]|jgi:thiol:disulfide interchange protein DsbD